ncbi:MAG: hypothetical protein L0Y58_08210 [Verrucomicrobia subdivision 3 bacterium]|nr:hypothetical protein [Limisphaerales bacterium]
MKNILKLTRFTVLAAASLAAAPAFAQEFNIDYRNPRGVPPAAYPAVAGPGVWNNPPGPAAFGPLLNLGGAPTAAGIVGAAIGAFSFDDPACPVPHSRLYEDGLVVGAPAGGGMFVVGPLVAGTYEVYTYAWAPGMPANVTQVSVLGSIDGAQNVGGAWPGWHWEGITYAHHTGIAVAAGGSIFIQLNASTPGSTPRLSGLQIRFDDGDHNNPNNPN